jgi:hypothetical protein
MKHIMIATTILTAAVAAATAGNASSAAGGGCYSKNATIKKRVFPTPCCGSALSSRTETASQTSAAGVPIAS